jgi:hypothetical protein
LHFTPADMTVVDADGATPGVQIVSGDCPEPEFVLTQEANNTAGTVGYVVTQLNPTPPFSGDCAVAHIRFMTHQEASTGVGFTSLTLSDNAFGQIPADTVDLALEIGPEFYYSHVPVVIGKED